MPNETAKKMTLKELEKLLGHKIELVDKKIVPVEDVPVGDTFMFAGVEFVVLNNNGTGIEVITKNVQNESVFDSATNRYVNSMASSKCNLFYETMKSHKDFKDAKAKLNEDVLLTFEMDLTTLDGRSVGPMRGCHVELPTFDIYRKYVNILDEHQCNKSWMFATAISTKENGDENVCIWDKKTKTIAFMYIQHTAGIRPYMIFNKKVVVEAL